MVRRKVEAEGGQQGDSPRGPCCAEVSRGAGGRAGQMSRKAVRVGASVRSSAVRAALTPLRGPTGACVPGAGQASGVLTNSRDRDGSGDPITLSLAGH